MTDNPEAVAAPVEQPGMASRGNGTLGKGMGRAKVWGRKIQDEGLS